MAKRASLSLRARGINSAADEPPKEQVQDKAPAPKKKSPPKKARRAPPKADRPADEAPHDASPERVIRDSFTMPAFDYGRISELQTKCMKQGIGMTKGEILRAGLIALSGMAPKQLAAAATKVVKIKTGRPKS